MAAVEQESEKFATEAILIGSDYSTRPLTLDNVTAFHFKADHLINYYLEYVPDPAKPDTTELLFLEEGQEHVFEVLQGLGFTAISKKFAPKEIHQKYGALENDSRFMEWDVLDDSGRFSIYLNFFKEIDATFSNASEPESDTIPAYYSESPIVKLEDEEVLQLTYENTCVYLYKEPYTNLNHVRVQSVDKNGYYTYFAADELIEVLIGQNYPHFIQPFPEEKTLASLANIEITGFDDTAAKYFDIRPGENS
jgi:hypothetical protein